LITTDNLASLADHECFVGLPEPKIRIAKIKVPLAKKAQDIHSGFIMRQQIKPDTFTNEEEITQAKQQSQAATEDQQSKTSDKSDSLSAASFKSLTQSLTENTDDEEPTSKQKLVTSLNSKLLWSKSSKDQKNIEDRGNLEELNAEDLEHEAQDQELTIINNLK